MKKQYEQAAIFLLGAAIGTTIGLILATLFTPRSGQETRHLIKDRGTAFKARVVSDTGDFSDRIQAATDAWIAQLGQVADELVAQGRMSADEARTQINELIEKVRS